MEPTHPPYVSGSLVVPRQLNRWLDINPQNGALTRTGTYVTLPAFSVADSWNGYSDIVASFNIEAPNNISLIGVTYPTSPNYALCVSYRIGGTLTRYLLWDATGSNFNQVIPLYTGQPLKKNFRFEVWNTSQGATSSGSDITFYTSKKGNIDYRYGNDSVLVATGAENDLFDCTSATTVTTPDAYSQFLPSGYPVGGKWVNSTNTVSLTKSGAVTKAPTGGTTADVIILGAGNFTNFTTQSGIVEYDILFYPSVMVDALLNFGTGYVSGNYGLSISGGSLYCDSAFSIGVTTPAVDTWYVARISVVQVLTNYVTTFKLYNAQTGALVASTTGTNAALRACTGLNINPSNNNALAIGEIRLYQSVRTTAEFNTLLQYYQCTYFGTTIFALPITFPATSVSTTN